MTKLRLLLKDLLAGIVLGIIELSFPGITYVLVLVIIAGIIVIADAVMTSSTSRRAGLQIESLRKGTRDWVCGNSYLGIIRYRRAILATFGRSIGGYRVAHLHVEFSQQV